MIVSRKDPFGSTINVMDLPITEAQLLEWSNGGLAQDVFPHLTASEREFIISGITPEIWKKMLGEV